MKKLLKFSCGLLTIFTLTATMSTLWAQGMGISTYPLQVDYGHLTTEYVGMVDSADGAGIQARYTHKINSTVTLDGGVGIGNKDLNNRAFISADIEFFPDYAQQPRISLKPFIETANEFGNRRNIIGVTPLFSKAITVFERPLYPFVGPSFGLVLDTTERKYEFRTVAAFGVAGKLPFGNFENVIFNIEGDWGVQNAYSSLSLGLSFPLL